MKKIYLLSLLLVAATFFSCDDDDSISSTGGSLGEITASRSTTSLVTGQYVTFTVPVTLSTPQQNIDEVRWGIVDGATVNLIDYVENGECSYTTSFSTIGSQTLECKYRYTMVDGTKEILSSSIDIFVKMSHIGNSVLGEAREVVEADNTLFPDEENDDIMSYSNTKTNISYFFFFKDGLLNSGFTNLIVTNTSEVAAYSMIFSDYYTYKSKLDTNNLTYSVTYADGYTPTSEIEEAVAWYEGKSTTTNTTTTDAMIIINSAMLAGNITKIAITAPIIDDSSVEFEISVEVTDAALCKYKRSTLVQFI